MAKPYRKSGSKFWWLAFTDAHGERQWMSSETEDEAEAQKRLDGMLKRVEAEKRAGVNRAARPTLRWYAEEKWLPKREAQGVRSVDNDRARFAHVLPVLGETLLKDITRPMLVDFMATFTERIGVRKEDMSPRLVLHIYGAIRVLMSDAVADGLIPFSPATLKVRRGELPEKRDKDPRWREQAVFKRLEVEQLISDQRIPEWRRTFWALIFLGCMRVNEATSRRWRDYDPDLEPLGRLTINSHWDVKKFKEIPGTKTCPRREMPVHPTLAKMLARWKLSGWEAMNGRKLTPDDWIVEAPRGERLPLNSNSTLQQLHGDCGTLGIRPRRQHDSRRTFVSIARSLPGANDFLLKWSTHGPARGTILDEYSTPPWAALCGQVSPVKIGLLGARLTAVKGEP